jgi:hypothetical protein
MKNLLSFATFALLCASPAFAAEESAKDPQAAKEPKAEITVKGTKNEEEAKAKLRADAAVARCVIKPVMTDDEIRICVDAYRQSR